MWRRLAMAVPVSVLVHILILVLGRPEYVEVSDYAVELEVVEIDQGKPATGPEPEPVPPEDEEVEEPETEPVADPEPEADETAISLVEDPAPSAAPDAGVVAAADRDGGPSGVAAIEGDGGPGEGTGICFHDVFPFAEENPSWLLWVSMSSFEGTVYEEGLARTLGSFSLYKEMAGATGLDPYRDVEGFLVTADDFADWRTYRVVATYKTGEEVLMSRLEKNRGTRKGFSWTRTRAGLEGALPGAYRWHLVGSGRVVAITHEPRKAIIQAPGSAAADAGPSMTARDAGPPAVKELPAPSFPDWPRQVACMGRTSPLKPDDELRMFRDLAHSMISPDADGRWPAALIATRDPKAVGLIQGKGMEAGFRWAVVRARFSDPVRIEGKVRLDGTGEQLEAVASGWRKMISRAGADPFMKLAGLGHLFDELELEAVDDGVEFEIRLTESQIQAALMFLQLQGEQLDKMINRRTADRPRPDREAN